MDFIALVSGGKDSIYSACRLIDEGNRLVGLVHIASRDAYSDSYMYQTVGSEAAVMVGQCMGVPIYIFKSSCRALNTSLEYSESPGDEVEDLHEAIQTVMSHCTFQAVSSGAILSVYQKNRVEAVCARLGLVSLAPLWKRDQKELLGEMIEYGIDARIIKVASPVLGKECLNMTLSEVRDHIDRHSKYEMNYCGEGGEYETLVLDCRHFIKRLSVGSYEIHGHPDEKGRDNGVYFIRFTGLNLIDKI